LSEAAIFINILFIEDMSAKILLTVWRMSALLFLSAESEFSLFPSHLAIDEEDSLRDAACLEH
jgi:hypothetical protein